MIIERILHERNKIENLMSEIAILQDHEEHKAHAMADLIIKHQDHYKELVTLLMPCVDKHGDLYAEGRLLVEREVAIQIFGTVKESYLN